jgi:hypothetical protein
MAQRTISDAGGDFNNTATWVEGVVPTSSDHIVATATSGQLTVNVASTVQYADLSGYTNTLTMNSTLTLGLAGGTTIFGAGMDFLPASPWATAQPIICNVNHTFVQNTTNIIPWLRTGGGTKTLSTNMYLGALEVSSATNFNGNTIFINGTFISAFGAIGGNSIFRLVGSGSLQVPTFGGTLIIDTLGTYTGSTIGVGLNSGSNITYISGTIINGRLKPLTGSGVITFDLGSSQWLSFDSAVTPTTVNLSSDFNVSILCHRCQGILTFGGTGGLKVANFSTIGTIDNVTGSIVVNSPRVVLNTTGTHTIGKLVQNGWAATAAGSSQGELKSTTPGTKATVNLTGNTFDSSISFLNITDINASGGNEIFANQCVLSNTDNITTTPPTGGGGGSFAFTYVN